MNDVIEKVGHTTFSCCSFDQHHETQTDASVSNETAKIIRLLPASQSAKVKLHKGHIIKVKLTDIQSVHIKFCIKSN